MRTVIYILLGIIPCVIDTEVALTVKIIMFSFLVFNIYIVAEMVEIIKRRSEKEKELKQKGI